MKKYFLFLDYDGTLTPIVKKPDLAMLTKARRSTLKKIAKAPHILVAIISGRKLSDLKQKVGIPGLIYAGNHGFEIAGPGLKIIHSQAKQSKPILKKIKSELQKRLKAIKGTIIEDKGLSLSLHFRLVKAKDLKKVKEIFATTTQPHLKKVRITHGKKVFEVRPPVKWDKGKAVLWILKKFGGKMIPVYIGDDTTDEDAFRALKNKGLTMRVGKIKGSSAQHFIKNVDGVYKLIKSMLKSLPRRT